MVILIPARGGSKRIPNKALKELGGKPLIQWAVDACASVDYSGPIRTVVCSDSGDILDAVMVETWLRPLDTASDDAPDISWLSLALAKYPDDDLFMIRRPTSPFIRAETMNRALDDFERRPDATAMRAMRPVTEHPDKMWQRSGVWMTPIIGRSGYGVEAWSTPTQLLPRVYVQTAGLEIIRRSTLECGSLTGNNVVPLFLDGAEALDINTPEDWAKAEEVAQTWTP